MSEPSAGSPPTPGASFQDPPPSVWRDARGALSFIFRSPLVISLIGFLTFVTSLFAVFNAGRQGLAPLHLRQDTLWHMLAALALTTWVTTIVIVLGDFNRNRSAWPRTRREWMGVALYVSLTIPMHALPLLSQHYAWKEEPLVHAAVLRLEPHPSLTKSLLINLLGLTNAALLTLGVVSVTVQLLARLPEYRRREEQHPSENLDEDVRWYQECRSRLRWFLNLIAFVIGISVLAMGAFRNLLNLSNLGSGAVFPIAPVIGYGLYYTGLIGGIYLSVDRILKDVGRTLTTRLVHQSLGEHATWKQRAEEQQAARTYLELQKSALQEFQQGLTVLSPLLASISSLILSPGP